MHVFFTLNVYSGISKSGQPCSVVHAALDSRGARRLQPCTEMHMRFYSSPTHLPNTSPAPIPMAIWVKITTTPSPRPGPPSLHQPLAEDPPGPVQDMASYAKNGPTSRALALDLVLRTFMNSADFSLSNSKIWDNISRLVPGTTPQQVSPLALAIAP